MENLVPVHVGLMGHIDHGKTALAKALSSKVSTAGLDKHPQAKQRGITIDLGFTMFKMDKLLVTLVDAPGHADLIRSVVAGANIIDAAILVIAADEG
ncbi:MAG: GTP-binding protein, partial [Candidatus Thorarchaeota archaeon]